MICVLDLAFPHLSYNHNLPRSVAICDGVVVLCVYPRSMAGITLSKQLHPGYLTGCDVEFGHEYSHYLIE